MLLQLSVLASCLIWAGSALAAPPNQAAQKTSITWYGHAAALFTSPAGTRVLIDPWLDHPKAAPDAKLPAQIDAILVTHGHFDHLGSAPQLAKKTGAPVIGSFELVSQLGLPEAQAIGGNPGGTYALKDLTVHFTEAVHSSSLTSPGGAPRFGGSRFGFRDRRKKRADDLPRRRHRRVRLDAADRATLPAHGGPVAYRRPLHHGPRRRRPGR